MKKRETTEQTRVWAARSIWLLLGALALAVIAGLRISLPASQADLQAASAAGGGMAAVPPLSRGSVEGVSPASTGAQAPVGAVSNAPNAPAITAVLTDALAVDNDNDTMADPGDTLKYTAVITNGGMDATGVVYSETLDPLTSLVGGSLNVSPLAFDDTFTAVGNTLLAVGVSPPANTPAVQVSGSLFANDTEFLGDTFSLSSFQATSANGGTVSVNAGGTFTYLPAVNFAGTDTFTYTVIDGAGLTGVGVVTINVVNRVWYVNNALGVNGDGRSTSPFNTLANINSTTGIGDADGDDDYLYIFTGSAPYVGGLPLEAGQTLIGQGVALVVGGFTLHPVGSRPTLTNVAGNIITLSTGNTIRGLNTGDTTGVDILGASFGTLTVSDVAAQGTGRALSLTTGTLSVVLDSIESTSSTGGPGILLSGVSGTMNVTGPTDITNPADIGLSVATSSATLTFGNTTVSGSGNTGVSLASNSGSITFGSLSITPDNGFRGLHATGNTGALASSSGTITTTTNVAVEIVGTSAANRTPLNLQFRSVASNGGTNGIALTNTSSTGSPGGFRVNGNGSTLASGGTLQAGSGEGILLTDVVNVRFNYMDVKNYQNNGVLGTRVSGFNMTGGRVQNNTNGLVEAGIQLNDVLGTSAVNSTEVSGSTEDNVRVFNTSQTGTFTWTGGSVHDNSTASGNMGINLMSASTGNLMGVVSGTLLYGNRTIALRGDAADGSTLDVTFRNNTIRSGLPGNQGNQGIEVSRVLTSNATFAVEGNKVGTDGVTNLPLLNTGINIFSGSTGGMTTGTVKDNTVRNAGAGFNGFGIRVLNSGTGTMNVNVSSNTVSNVGLDYGIFVESSGAVAPGVGAMQAGVTNNNVTVLGTALDAIRVGARNNNTVCAQYSGNTTGGGGTGFFGIFIRQANTAVTNLEGLAPGLQTNPAVIIAALTALNPTGTSWGELHALGITGVAPGACSAIPAGPAGAARTGAKVPKNSVDAGVSASRREESGSTDETAAAPQAPENQASNGTTAQKSEGNSSSGNSGTQKVVGSQGSQYSKGQQAKAPPPTAMLDVVNVTVGTLPAGKRLVIVFRALIAGPPIPAGVHFLSTQGEISGSNFTTVLTDDPDIAGSNNPTLTPLDATPDLVIDKADDGATYSPGQTVAYTLSYSNTGTQGATGVVLTDTVPNDTTFNAGASSPGWTCVPNGNPGGVCTNPVGNVGASGSKVFAVTIGSGLPFGTGTITNTASIGDDNANGADLNPADNTDTDTTNVFVPTPTPTSTNTPAVTNTPTSTNTPTNTPTATMTPTPGTNGCRPGYWKDHQNNWPAPYTPSTTLGSVFTLPACGGINTLAGDTFSQALDYGGGPTIKDAAQQLLRQAVAALLNAASGIGYPLHQAQIINEVNTALASCNRDTIQAEAQRLEDFNRSHCPLP